MYNETRLMILALTVTHTHMAKYFYFIISCDESNFLINKNVFANNENSPCNN